VNYPFYDFYFSLLQKFPVQTGQINTNEDAGFAKTKSYSVFANSFKIKSKIYTLGASLQG
jgi:hypothetical protein